jgi:hypothetical protein
MSHISGNAASAIIIITKEQDGATNKLNHH